MMENVTMQCPHGESNEEFPLYSLLTHLENCPSPCGDAPAGSSDNKGCDHLSKFERSVAEIATNNACPHSSCGKEVPNLRNFPQHLERCKGSCDDLNDGHCNHQSEVDNILAELFKDTGDHKEVPISGQAGGPDTGERSGEKQLLGCPHEDCHELFAGTVDEVLSHLKLCEMPCTANGKGCEHLNNLDVFCNEFVGQAQMKEEDQCNLIPEGQPPVFSPPVDASPEEIRELRRQHRQKVKSLTPEERRQRQLIRNRRTARISKQRRQEQTVSLKRENLKLRQALQSLYVRYSSLRQKINSLAGEH